MNKPRVPVRILAAAAGVTVALSLAAPATADDPWARAAAKSPAPACPPAALPL